MREGWICEALDDREAIVTSPDGHRVSMRRGGDGVKVRINGGGQRSLDVIVDDDWVVRTHVGGTREVRRVLQERA